MQGEIVKDVSASDTLSKGQKVTYFYVTLSLPDCTSEADVVFMIDASSSIGEDNYYRMWSVVTDLASALHSEVENIHLAIETFANSTEVVYSLDDRVPRKSQMNAINVPYVRGTTNTDKALLCV